MENNKKIKPNSYYSIQYWMINELGLKGLELSIYAIIYGFSRDHCGAFTGSRSYLADFTNSTKAGVDKALKSLIQKNLLEKKDFVNHGIKNCIYVAKEVANLVSYQSTELGGVANSVSQGSQLSCPNNIEDNIEDNTLSLEVKHFGLYGNVILNDELHDTFHSFRHCDSTYTVPCLWWSNQIRSSLHIPSYCLIESNCPLIHINIVHC